MNNHTYAHTCTQAHGGTDTGTHIGTHTNMLILAKRYHCKHAKATTTESFLLGVQWEIRLLIEDRLICVLLRLNEADVNIRSFPPVMMADAPTIEQLYRTPGLTSAHPEAGNVSVSLTRPFTVSLLCNLATGALCSRFSSICQAMMVMFPMRSFSTDLTVSHTHPVIRHYL